MDSYRPPASSQPPQGRPFGLRLSSLPHHPHNHTALTPVSFLLRGALIHPHKLALTHPERSWQLTYSQWAARCLSLAFALRTCVPGWKKGDRVAIITPNAPLILDAYHGVLAAGGVVVPINIRNIKSEVDYVLEHSGATVVLVDHEMKHLVDAAPGTSSASSSSTRRTIIVSNDSGGQDPSDAYEAFLQRGRQAWDEAQRAEDSRHPEGQALLDWELLETVEETDMAAICYTSGTTGRPKGVVTNHRGSYLAAVANAVEAGLGYDSVYNWTLPCFHALGWNFPFACTLSFAVQRIQRRVEPAMIWDALINDGVTHLSGAPTVMISLVNHPSARRLPQPVRIAVAASAPTADLLGKMEALHLMPVHVYGLTESYGPMTRRYQDPSWADLELGDRATLMARQGHGFLTADEARVVKLDAEKNVVTSADGKRLVDVRRDGEELGEIALRGNIVMDEYYRDEAATKKTVRSGWFLTGDLAVRHPGGELQITDRGKDIIVSGGENVSSLAVESTLASHSSILECCVVARPHTKWGERGHAFVVLKEGKQGSISQEDVKQFCKGKMSGFAIPEWVEIVDELPKTSTGKVQKNVLRKRVAELADTQRASKL